MSYYDDLMKKATYEQQRELQRLRALVGERKKLLEETKKSCDKESSSRYQFPRLEPDDVFRPMTDEQAEAHLKSYSSSTQEKLRNVEGRIKKATENAARNGLLVVDISKLV